MTLIKNGEVRVEIKLLEACTIAVTLFAYFEYQDMIDIDSEMNPATKVKKAMDTRQITQVLSTNNITKNAYIGTFPCVKLPIKIDQIPLAILVNTDVHTKPGTHWFAIYLPSVKEPIEYFDSYGGESTNKYIVKFLEMVDQYSYNSRRVQHLFSTKCGQHCIYFLSNRCKGTS